MLKNEGDELKKKRKNIFLILSIGKTGHEVSKVTVKKMIKDGHNLSEIVNILL
jgi:hypothetical protein